MKSFLLILISIICSNVFAQDCDSISEDDRLSLRAYQYVLDAAQSDEFMTYDINGKVLSQECIFSLFYLTKKNSGALDILTLAHESFELVVFCSDGFKIESITIFISDYDEYGNHLGRKFLCAIRPKE